MADYRERLASQLRIAAHQSLALREATPTRALLVPTRKRRWLVSGLVAAALATPAALAGSEMFGGDTDSGQFPDGSTFRVWTAPDAEYGSCEHLELRGPSGEFGGLSTACPAAGSAARPKTRLAVGWIYAPADTMLLRGTAPDGTASIEVRDAIGSVKFDRRGMTFAAQIPRDARMVVIARDDSGDELDRFDAPPDGSRPVRFPDTP